MPHFDSDNGKEVNKHINTIKRQGELSTTPTYPYPMSRYAEECLTDEGSYLQKAIVHGSDDRKSQQNHTNPDLTLPYLQCLAQVSRYLNLTESNKALRCCLN